MTAATVRALGALAVLSATRGVGTAGAERFWRTGGLAAATGTREVRGPTWVVVSGVLLAPADPRVSAKAEGMAAIADPIPNAMAKPPTLPTYLA